MFQELDNTLGAAEVKQELGILRHAEHCHEDARVCLVEAVVLFRQAWAVQEALRAKQMLEGLKVGALGQ